ncbi:MAG: hypothetical protein KUG81_02530, partial [Gammaproteobacteria bacterium]|nr:hypothetical protein [Gammaproteobacteria bacterium]
VHYIHTIVYEGGEPVLDSDGYQVIDNNGDPVFYNAGDTSTIEFNDTLSHIEEITGTQFDDTLHGDNENNVINGGAGENIISGGGGHDTLTGNGELNGGDGHDWLNGDGILSGGNGYDTLIGSGTLHGDEGDDFLSGTGDLYGDSGHDWLYGAGILRGGSGSDHLDGSGTLIGGSGQDFLIASEDGTVLDGGSDNDSLDGNGKNSITYVAKGGIDVINDDGSGFLFMDGTASSAKYEYAENGSLVITSGGSTAVIIQAQIGGISFNDGISFVNVPLDGTSFVENEFDQNFIGTFGGDVYTANQGTEDSLSLLGNDTFNFDAFTLYNHKSTIGVYDLSSIGGLIVINNGILQDFDVTRDVSTDSLGGYSLNLQYGENNYIELNGDTNDISQSLDVVLEDGTYDLSSFQVTTYGSPGDDSTGTMDPIADKIFGDVEGFSTDDIIYAGFGNDEVEGGLGNDIIYGEHGDDIIDGGDGDDTLYGGAGNDTLRGGDGDDTFIDSDGDDIYRVGNGDIVHLSSGNNEIIVTSTELSGVTIDLSDFEDIENDGTGLARDFSGNSSGYNYKLLYGGNSVDIRDIIKQDNAPIIKFSDGSAATLNTPLITGFGSDDADQYSENTAQINDLIYAGGGNDVFSMWYGNDTVYGGEGDDQIRAITISEDSPNSSGHLTAYGEAGNDSLGGGIGNDSLYGGDGNDIITDISGGDNELFGGAGDDFFLLAWDGGDTVDGGEGIDTVAMSFANQNAPTEYDYEIDLENQTITSGGGTHELTSIENALGSEQDDTLIGNDQDNVLGGGAGNDTLHGGAGDDIYYISGSIDVSGVSIPSGDDNVIDVDGADTILLSEVDSIGAVTLLEEGTNLRINIAGGGSVVVTGQLSGVAELQVENLELSDGTIYDLVNYSSWYVDGDEGGSDPAPVPIVATAAPDFIIGTPITIDTADFSYSLDAVTIDLLNGFSAGGYAQGDILLFIDNIIGSALNDILTGSAGNNVLTGGAGDDVLNGGDGDDTYMFSLGDGNNTITDTSGFDVIQ